MIDKLSAREMNHWSIISRKINEIIDFLNEAPEKVEKAEKIEEKSNLDQKGNNF